MLVVLASMAPGLSAIDVARVWTDAVRERLEMLLGLFLTASESVLKTREPKDSG